MSDYSGGYCGRIKTDLYIGGNLLVIVVPEDEKSLYNRIREKILTGQWSLCFIDQFSCYVLRGQAVALHPWKRIF